MIKNVLKIVCAFISSFALWCSMDYILRQITGVEHQNYNDVYLYSATFAIFWSVRVGYKIRKNREQLND